MNYKTNKILEELSKKEEVNEAKYRGDDTSEFKQGMNSLEYRVKDNMREIVREVYSTGNYTDREVFQGDVVTAIFTYLSGEVENLKNNRRAITEIIDILEDISDDNF